MAETMRLEEMSTIARLNTTYGVSFLLLLLLGYFTQGLRCFPWVAMSYWYKDTLKVTIPVQHFWL
jgi:hypothetical protein